MKKPSSKHVKIAVTVVISAVILYAIMSVIDNIGLVYESLKAAVSFVIRILNPILIGFIIAFLLHRPSDFFARLLQKIKFLKKRIRLSVVIGVFITFILFLTFLAAFLYLLIPSVIDSVKSLSRDIPEYADNVYKWVLDIGKSETVTKLLDYFGFKLTDASTVPEFISESWTEIAAVLQRIANSIFGFVLNTGMFLYNFVLGMFFTVYMLIYKRQIKLQLQTLSKAVFKGFHYKLAFACRVANDMFYKYIAGKGLCSIGLGIATFAICMILGFKYVPLISLIVAITNMIPTFGPFIGAVPAALLSLMTSPLHGLYILIIILGLQLIEGNIIAPRILGDSLGLNGFWIIFSVVIMGAFFGFIGMLISVPLFGLIRILIKNWLIRRNKEYEKLAPEMEYYASLQRYHEWTTKRIKCKEKKENAEL